MLKHKFELHMVSFKTDYGAGAYATLHATEKPSQAQMKALRDFMKLMEKRLIEDDFSDLV